MSVYGLGVKGDGEREERMEERREERQLRFEERRERQAVARYPGMLPAEAVLALQTERTTQTEVVEEASRNWAIYLAVGAGLLLLLMRR